jgi:hypothetical protein
MKSYVQTMDFSQQRILKEQQSRCRRIQAERT